MPNEQQNIVDKIRKLFTLAQSPNEAEAHLAQARAQELLAKYNLDMAVVRDVPGADTEKREKTKIDRAAKFKWQRALWKVLAETNYCWYWVQTIEHAKRHVLLGRESNVITVKAMGEYLEDTMTRLCPVDPSLNQSARVRFTQLWKMGCADELIARIEAKAEALKSTTATTGTGKEIAVRDVLQVEYELNYDAAYGEGAFQRKRIREAEWEKAQAERERKAEEARIQAEKEWLLYLQNETPEQKQAREKLEERERRAEERRWLRRSARYSYSSWRESRKADTDDSEDETYRAGRKAGKDVRLDAQIDYNSGKRQIAGLL